MKELRLVGMAFMAILMCVNFVACSNNEVPIPEEPQKDKLITVGLKCTGEFLDITNSPFSRVEGGDEYHIQVFSLEEKTEDGALVLTEEGKRVAERTYERHRVLSAFFEKIGVSKETASEDACRIEHTISDETFEALKKYAGLE